MGDMPEQEQSMERLRFDSQAVIFRTAQIIAGHEIERDLDTVGVYFAKSPLIGARAETDFPPLENLTEEQISEIRTEAAKVGIGAERSIGLEEAGLPEGTTIVTEGGLPNKILAQLKMIVEGGSPDRLLNERSRVEQVDRQPGVIVLSASQTRSAGNSDATRMQQIAETLGVGTPDVGNKTEFELAMITAGLYPAFDSEEPVFLPFGYELHDGGITPIVEATGQAVRIGSVNGSPVVVLGLKEFHRDDSRKNFYRPTITDLKGVAHQIATYLNPEAANKPVATVTSHLYGPSRRLMDPGTLTYGTEVMGEVVGEAAAQASIPNIVSELDRTREILLQQAA